MTTLLLPTRQDAPFYDFAIALDGVTFRLEFHWNLKDSAWYFSIFDATDVPLLSGIKVVVGVPLISRYRDPRLPAGDLSAIDTTGTDTEAAFEDLGTRVHLLYTEAADIPPEWRTA